MGTSYDPIGRRLQAQLRIAEIDGLLEEIHVDLTLAGSSPFERNYRLLMETKLRRERQSLCEELSSSL